ncbi:OLC1v1036086C2 [Oldenlandia corymbosa var. corymbosa]|nr:OLC1v1036086C2 [Oldenlandia corymbosa var. corymbosa]
MMGIRLSFRGLFILFVLSISITYSEQLQESQAQTLLRIQHLLNLPQVWSSRKNETDFCNLEPSSILTVVCYEESITQLHIIGNKTTQLPENFSIDSLVNALVKLPDLKVLKLVSAGLWGRLPNALSHLSLLEILDVSSNFFHGPIPEGIFSMTGLQALIVDGNMFDGRIPEVLSSLSALTVLSVKNNLFSGSLPDSVRSLENLRVLALSNNRFSRAVPDLTNLENLQVLDLENNAFGPKFPQVGNKIVRIVLRKNNFTFGLPDQLKSCYQLEHLDVSSNKFVGPFPSYFLSLPSIIYLDIAENRFTGMLFDDLSCNNELKFVNLSANLLAGELPSCLLSQTRSRIVEYAGNCFSTGDATQKPYSYCQTEALAVGVLPHHKKEKEASKLILAGSIVGGLIGAIVLILLVFLLIRRYRTRNLLVEKPVRTIEEHVAAGYTSKLLSDARYVTQKLKLGALGLPPYRTFSLEEIEEATNNFHSSTLTDEGSHGQVYIGQLKDASRSRVVIRCLKLKKRKSVQNFVHQIELMSKLRHQHLVCALGHCFEFYLDDSSVSRIFLVFEYVPNRSLRSWISDRHSKRKLNWPQRIAAAIGVAKGIQFLHGGIVPGIFPNNLKITDILLDQNLAAKISSYNLPLLAECVEKESTESSPGSSTAFRSIRVKNHEKFDIHDFGVILLEMITGRTINTKNEIIILKDQVQASITADDATRKSVADPAITAACSDESLKTMIEICCKCLLRNPSDRPSVEDILWNLQFSAQVQDAWKSCESNSSDSSPVSSFKPPRLRLSAPGN